MELTSTFRKQFTFLFIFSVSVHWVNAQMAAGHPKFVGNIFGNTIPASFDTYWNQVTPENSGKWGSVEGVRDTMNWSALDIAYNYAQDKGFPFKQHAFVWGVQEPSWVSGLSPADQAAEVEEWIQLYAGRYPNSDMIDVVNEPLHVVPSYAEAIGGSGTTGWDWVVWSFEKARQYCPNAKLILNDYGILGKRKETNDYLKIINILKDRGLIDGIGVQAHGLEYAQNNAIQTSLDDLAATGLPIYVSEFDLEFSDDTEQLNRYQSLFPLLYEHPGVAGVTLWGYVAGQHWKPDAYLLGEEILLGSYTVTTAFQDYSVSGSGDVQVHLTNDNDNNSHDLETDYVVLDGTAFQSEDMEINTGVWQDNSCGGSFSQWMHCNGYIQFPAASQSITVRARGVLGSENMEIRSVDMNVERPALTWLRTSYFGDTNEIPSASFTYTSTLLSVDFDGSGSTDIDGFISGWEWDFGDGTTGSGELVSHSYTSSGNYSVTLTVTDNEGATDTEVQSVSVSDGNSIPIATFTYSTNLLTADFDGSGSSDSDGTISSWSWDFGDGGTGSGELISHTYASSGSYDVVLTVTDDGGATDSEMQTVTVSDGSGPTTLHVENIITYTLSAGQGSKRGVAEITIHDDQENAVDAASVTATFSGSFNETVSGQTGTDGVVVLQTTGTAKGSVTVEVCVDEVTHSTFIYDNSQNDITCTGSNGRFAEMQTTYKSTQVSVYPNPSSAGSFTIDIPTGFDPENADIFIYNMDGSLIFYQQLDALGRTVPLKHSLQSGIYLIRISNKKTRLDAKLLVR